MAGDGCSVRRAAAKEKNAAEAGEGEWGVGGAGDACLPTSGSNKAGLH